MDPCLGVRKSGVCSMCVGVSVLRGDCVEESWERTDSKRKRDTLCVGLQVGCVWNGRCFDERLLDRTPGDEGVRLNVRMFLSQHKQRSNQIR